MLDELASLPEKITEAEWPNETIVLRPWVESDGEANPFEIRAERAKWRRRKMRKLHAKGAWCRSPNSVIENPVACFLLGGVTQADLLVTLALGGIAVVRAPFL